MKLIGASLLTALVCLTVSACRLPGPSKKGAEPKGQVIAVVNGDEVTMTDLRAEIAGISAPNPEAQKALELASLQQIVGRKILSDAAHAQDLDKTPEFAVQRKRALEMVAALILQRKLAGQVPPPTRDEAQRFVEEHPDMFAQRRFYILDQIRMKRPPDAQKLKQLEPLKTMTEVEGWMAQQKVDYERAVDAFDTFGTDPRLVDFIEKLPPSEVFVVPRGDILLINQILEVRQVPLTGDRAVTYALDLIRNQRTLEAVARAENQILAKSAGAVRYAAAYKPPPANAPAPTSDEGLPSRMNPNAAAK
jgi:peptidyl-prolyl cis-trans isomerase C